MWLKHAVDKGLRAMMQKCEKCQTRMNRGFERFAYRKIVRTFVMLLMIK